MRTHVCIIGGGPSGLLLSQLLHRAGVDTVVLERRSKDYVLSRIRAGVLEWGSVETLRRAGVSERMDREGEVHGGIVLAGENQGFRVDIDALTGKQVMVFGQTEVTTELYDAREAMGGTIITEADGVTLHGLDTDAPHVTYLKDGSEHRIDCDFVAGCDGFHGVSRKAIPSTILKTFERVYPFGWLGVLSRTPPATSEILYAQHSRGIALCSLRSPELSRYYIQVPSGEDPTAWTDDAFWDELGRRLPPEVAEPLVTGPSIEKSVAPLRSFVAEPMRWGRLFLVGDAAHIVPPTGAKGLNLAIGDVHYLTDGLIAHYDGALEKLDAYSETALKRVWGAMRFSWWMTSLLHTFPDATPFEQRMQNIEILQLAHMTSAQRYLADQYVGLPY